MNFLLNSRQTGWRRRDIDGAVALWRPTVLRVPHDLGSATQPPIVRPGAGDGPEYGFVKRLSLLKSIQNEVDLYRTYSQNTVRYS